MLQMGRRCLRQGVRFKLRRLKISPHSSPPPAGEDAKPTADRCASCTWLLPLPPLKEAWDGGWLPGHTTLNRTLRQVRLVHRRHSA